ncbi:MAG: Gfo/Idh/MocA family oxidoreductase, partial [Planctomycetota bacterium]
MIRWGLIGCGDVAHKRVADAILQDSRSTLVAACRRNSEKLASFASQFNVPSTTTDAMELIRQTDVDAVYIATPVSLHCEQTLAAAEAGKHVLVEKPMAMNPAECKQMVDQCQESSVTLGVAFYRPFYPVITRVRSILKGKEIGRTLSVLVTTGNPTRFPADDWRVVLSEGGGGPLMDIGSHRLDLLIDLFGQVTESSGFTIASPDYEAE